jgi:anthranilate synthase component 1
MHLTSYVRRLKPGLERSTCTSPPSGGTLSGALKVRPWRSSPSSRDSPAPQRRGHRLAGLDKDSVNLDTGITIRSLWIRDGKVHWQAGAGIVYDSVPEKEWQECNNKARVIREVVRGKEGGDVFAHR